MHETNFFKNNVLKQKLPKITKQKILHHCKDNNFKRKHSRTKNDSFYNITNIIVVVLESESIILRQTKKLVLIINIIYAIYFGLYVTRN